MVAGHRPKDSTMTRIALALSHGLARKVHYSCDLFFAVSWGLITGFDSPFPWFYSVFFTVMIAHRAMRDITKCRQNHGDAWR